MKFGSRKPEAKAFKSLPVRGAWIEMTSVTTTCILLNCRSPCGERGLKCAWIKTDAYPWRRSPCGERGLKFPRLRLG